MAPGIIILAKGVLATGSPVAISGPYGTGTIDNISRKNTTQPSPPPFKSINIFKDKQTKL